MYDGGSGELTPEMVLAAAEPPPEAPGARSARAMGRNEDFWAWTELGLRRLLWSKSLAATGCRGRAARRPVLPPPRAPLQGTRGCGWGRQGFPLPGRPAVATLR